MVIKFFSGENSSVEKFFSGEILEKFFSGEYYVGKENCKGKFFNGEYLTESACQIANREYSDLKLLHQRKSDTCIRESIMTSYLTHINCRMSPVN